PGLPLPDVGVAVSHQQKETWGAPLEKGTQTFSVLAYQRQGKILGVLFALICQITGGKEIANYRKFADSREASLCRLKAESPYGTPYQSYVSPVGLLI
ncbi:MAG TPA: hypothetical protein VFM35_00900, partial [Candidatus Binatia bacterium]|nr:hypothetical protein [Candidatus Binatia bacterium]